MRRFRQQKLGHLTVTGKLSKLFPIACVSVALILTVLKNFEEIKAPAFMLLYFSLLLLQNCSKPKENKATATVGYGVLACISIWWPSLKRICLLREFFLLSGCLHC